MVMPPKGSRPLQEPSFNVRVEMGNVNPLIPPIHPSTTFLRNTDGSYNDGFVYSSLNNPNRQELEVELVGLEKGKTALAFASGMAAIHAVFQSLKTGDHVLIPNDVFYQVRRLMREVFEPWGLTYTIVDTRDTEAVQAAIQSNTALIWIETPSNPLLQLTDISTIAQIAHQNKCLLAVDNTWASPVLQNPLKWGADIVMHSTTKYIGGHHDVMGGCLVLKARGEWAEKLRKIQKLCGAVPAPKDCWMLSRGIKTLKLRLHQQADTALRLARFLESHPEVEEVYYPGLESHPQHQIAKQQMQGGYGAMLSFLVKGNAKRAMAVSNALQHFACATSLGGVDSLVEHRQSVEGADSRAPENLLRLSVGIEPFDDLKTDLSQALNLN